MRPALSMIALGIALAVTCSSPAPVHAEETTQRPAPALTGKVVDPEILADQRGGTDDHLSKIHAFGSVSEVQVQDAFTGHNIVTDNALSGASGLPMLIQNSGNGVLIQNAVILNIEVQ